MAEISIIIPVFNEAENISRLISYIRRHSLGVDCEIIVSDGGSTDGTLREVETANVILVKSPAKGRGAQMNVGAKIAKGRLLFFMHADTTPPANFLHQIVAKNKAGFDAGCFRLKFDHHHWFLKILEKCTHLNISAVRFGDQGLFVSREMFDKTGGYRNDFVILEDQEIVLRLTKMGARFGLIKDKMITSARKYLANGPVRLEWVFLQIWWHFWRGKSQDFLVKFYKRKIKDSKIEENDAKNVSQFADDFHKKPHRRESKNKAGKGLGT